MSRTTTDFMTTPTNPELQQPKPSAPAHGSAIEYAHEWTITVQSDTIRGAMEAVDTIWLAWKDGMEPCHGCCPAGMGERMAYKVEKTKSPMPGSSGKVQCPHCGSGILWSEDRGAHCDGCDDFDPESDLPNTQAQRPLADSDSGRKGKHGTT